MEHNSIYEIIIAALAGEASEQEQNALQDWLQESPENQEEYNNIKKLYLSLTSPGPAKTYDTEAAWQKVKPQPGSKKKYLAIPTFYRYAAIFILLFTAGFSFYRLSLSPHQEIIDPEQPTLLLQNGKQIPLSGNTFSMHKDNVWINNDGENMLVYESEETNDKIAGKIVTNHLIIPKRTTYHVVLSDGTKVWLNSASELIYPTRFSGDRREVTLTGEAYFEVAHNKEIPFYIHANGITVEVLGTSFNLDSYPSNEKIITTLVEGSVRIVTENNDRLLLSPSEQLIYNKESFTSEVQKVETSLYTSWKENRYIFRNATLQEIVSRLQHWHDFTVIYQNEELKNKRYTFTVGRQTAIEQLLEVINFTSDVKLERTENIIHVTQERKEE